MTLCRNSKKTVTFFIVLLLIIPSCHSDGQSDLSGLHANVTKLTDSTAQQNGMIWSPDSQSLYYQQDGRIRVAEIESGIRYALADGFNPTISYDSQELFFLTSSIAHEADGVQGELNALVVEQSSHEVTTIGAIDHPFPEDESAIWSPNGKHVALYVREEAPYQLENIIVAGKRYTRRLAIWDAVTGEINVLPYFQPRSHIPQWSPDGERLAVIGLIDEEINLSHKNGTHADLGIWIVDTTTGLATKIITDPNHVDFVTWSPEGSRLAFSTITSAMANAIENIWTINDDGSNKQLMVSIPLIPRTSFSDSRFDWGPDESQIAFVTYELKMDENENITNQTMQNIWIKDIDEMSEYLLLSTPFLHGFIGKLDWSPDGSTIALEYDRMRDDMVENQLIIDPGSTCIYLLDVR